MCVWVGVYMCCLSVVRRRLRQTSQINERTNERTKFKKKKKKKTHTYTHTEDERETVRERDRESERLWLENLHTRVNERWS